MLLTSLTLPLNADVKKLFAYPTGSLTIPAPFSSSPVTSPIQLSALSRRDCCSSSVTSSSGASSSYGSTTKQLGVDTSVASNTALQITLVDCFSTFV